MDFSDLETVESCLGGIKTLKGMGMPVPQELLDRLEMLKAAEKAAAEEAAEAERAAAEKLQNEGIYENFARTVPYSPELCQCIESTVDKLMEEGEEAKKPGLLLGKIQCGKTRAFVGIVGLAFDRGFDACVVFTKGTNALIEQTVTRLKYDFRNFLGISDLNRSCSVDVHDIMQIYNRLSRQQIEGQKNIIVCKKEHVNVARLLDLFKVSSPDLAKKRVLIVDDEADFVSHSFRTQHSEVYQGTVACRIDEFIRTLTYCRYLQVTATPYSLYLQPDGEVAVQNGVVYPFRPRFTSLVPIHANYIGGQQYFVEAHDNNSMYSHLFHRMSDDCIDRMLSSNRDNRLYTNVANTKYFQDLRWAMMSYFVGSAVRKIQVEEKFNINYLTSFLMHVSVAKEDHDWQATLVEGLLENWSNNTGSLKDLFKDVYDDMRQSISKGVKQHLLQQQIPEEQKVWQKVVQLLEEKRYLVQTVNSEIPVATLLDDSGQLRLTHDLNIFVGGFVLDRGITIDHMIGFMYGRRPGVEQQDTVLQHCRMFGNRSKEDMSVTRLHTTANLYDVMERMDYMDEQLREWFLNYSKGNTETDPSAVFVNLATDMNIIPCSPSRLVISDVTTIKPYKRITTYGFQTDCATRMNRVMPEIDALIAKQPKYVKDDVFEIEVDVVIEILHQIRSTFIYNRPIDNNSSYEWDEEEMIGCIKYATQNTNGKMLCLHRTGRKMGRIRANGNFVDAPEDGNTDTPLVKSKADTMPVIMLFRQEGREEQGWRGAPFYWPSLIMPKNTKPAIFSTRLGNQ